VDIDGVQYKYQNFSLLHSYFEGKHEPTHKLCSHCETLMTLDEYISEWGWCKACWVELGPRGPQDADFKVVPSPISAILIFKEEK
jgi:uncharacterized CHY-type Zn-finger protein